MDKVLNLHLLLSPVNWLVVFVIFTFWAFFAHAVNSSNNSSTK